MKITRLTAPMLIASLLLLTACPAEPIHMTSDPERAVREPSGPPQDPIKLQPTPEFQVTAAELTAKPTQGTGPCPVDINFSGSITANGKGQVTYTFVRSDGATAPVYMLEFSGSDTKQVSTTWKLGSAESLPSYTGWQTLKILSPNVLETPRDSGAFSINCQQ
jgi:hypothetical protein